MPVSPARAMAFEVLLRVESTNAYASELLHGRHLARLSHRDHHLCTELVMGVLRWRSALDTVIATRIGRGLEKLDIEVSTALRLGAYQLLLLDRIPARAAIHESVELVKRARKRSAAGMVNAILRNLPQKRVALDNESGHPPWLIERWRSGYGVDQTKQIRDHNQRPPTVAIRPIATLETQELGEEGIQLRNGHLLRSAFIVESGDITATRAFRERRVTIQDEASQLVAFLMGKGRVILDCCAAPGGKTRILAEENPGSSILALDVHPRRARLLGRLLADKNLWVIAADARTIPVRGSFDRILVDAPCSGTGTLARNPEIKWRLQLEDVSRLQAYQLAIVSAVLPHVSPGGRLLYSTCSLEQEENEQVIEKILARNPSFHLVSCFEELERLRSRGELVWQAIDALTSGPYLRTLPSVHPCDGFFAAILERK